MSKFENKVLSSTLKNKKVVSGIIAGAGGPFWKDAMDQSLFHALKVDNAKIKFAMVEDGNLLSIYVEDKDFDKAMEALSN
jgi:hypothetical protein